MAVQFTSAGNFRARVRNVNPTGEKHKTTWRTDSDLEDFQQAEEGSQPAQTLLPTASHTHQQSVTIRGLQDAADTTPEHKHRTCHSFVGVDPGALMEPQVNQVRGVPDTLWQGKQDTLHIGMHRISNHLKGTLATMKSSFSLATLSDTRMVLPTPALPTNMMGFLLRSSRSMK
ncbi:hypothetical protein EYF80_011690 [Liparis tanakae]|uniref:Uncharacterized protein n=1 Tax=Liparis tanakae TaxID=230148 RepID=A0A4Z2IK58_9TELE|nr:hypothetical protein EYF80_011690 [Liparis tanakae]